MTLRAAKLISLLQSLGFSFDEANTLRRAQLTLHGWAEAECGNGNDHCSWAIERDEQTGKPYRVIYPHHGNTVRQHIADRQKGAVKRIDSIMASHPDWLWYHQTDPRGCALWLVRKSDLRPGESIDSVYTRGIAICA